jgi:queuine/archaeosine tRNA-ribosyltransferase
MFQVVIIMFSHNLTHYLEFFAGLRAAIVDGSYDRFKAKILHRQ